jgi:DNA-binding NtrC family response regulator
LLLADGRETEGAAVKFFSRSDKGGVRADAVMTLETQTAQAVKRNTVERSSEPGPHVLIVEDDYMIRKATRGYFELEGLPSDACTTLEEARAIIREAEPRLMILDGKLPDGYGVDFCRELRDSGYTPPILIHTALSAASTMRAGYAAGCTDYIVKPFDVKLLLLKARRYLEYYEGSPVSR